MILNLVTLLVLGFAAYRLTRFFVIDTFVEGSRGKFYLFLSNRAQKHGRLHLLWEKTYELTSCTFCAGFWISATLYTIYIWRGPQDFSRIDVINIFAVAALQSLLHAFEPDDA